MGGQEEPVAIRPPNGSVVRLAQLGRALADGVEHGMNVGPRACDDAKNLAGRPLLLLRLIPLAFIQRDLLTHTGSGRSAAGGLWRSAALSRCHLTTSRFSLFAACSGAPSHCPPQGSGQGIVRVNFSTPEVIRTWLEERSFCSRPMTALGQ